jgi:hypothetical protein
MPWSDAEEQFERAKASFEQNFEQFRSLNQIMWQVPIIAMTLTGGLWFGAASVSDMPGFQYLLLILAVLANLGLAIVLVRVRYVMGEYLKAIKQFHAPSYVAAEGVWFQHSKTVAITFIILLLLSAAISLAGTCIVRQTEVNAPKTRRVIEVIDVTK